MSLPDLASATWSPRPSLTLATQVFDHPSIGAIAAHIATRLQPTPLPIPSAAPEASDPLRRRLREARFAAPANQSMARREARKPGRQAPRAAPAVAAVASAHGLAPDQVAEAVRSTVAQILGRQEVALDSPLMSEGLDSLGAVELRNSLQARLQLELPGTLVSVQSS